MQRPLTARVGGAQALICLNISAADTGKQAAGRGEGVQEGSSLWTWGPEIRWAPPLHGLWFGNLLFPLRKGPELGPAQRARVSR